jgi:hypothetical protein
MCVGCEEKRGFEVDIKGKKLGLILTDLVLSRFHRNLASHRHTDRQTNHPPNFTPPTCLC